MALFKRGNMWWVRFTDPGGREVRRSAQTRNRKEAQEFHDRLKASLWRQAKLGERPRRLWQEAVERWCAERVHKVSLSLTTYRIFDGCIRIFTTGIWTRSIAM